MKILCVFGQYAYGNPAKGEGYEHANFIPALRRLGHECELFDSCDRRYYSNFAELNRALLEKAEEFRPDIVLCVLMHYEVWLETIERLRSDLGCVVINWGTDDSWKFEQFSRFIAKHVDLYATTNAHAFAKARQEGIASFVLTQWAASGEALKEPVSFPECAFDVSFVGAAYGNRPRWISELARRGIKVDCFGAGWPNGPVDTATMRSIIRSSRISLNFGDSGLQWRGLGLKRSRQIKARTFEVPGAGGMLITERAEGLENYYAIGEEIDVFSGADELAAKIRRYLADPPLRDLVARAGHERTRSEHTYENRFVKLVSAAALSRKVDDREPQCRVNWTTFEQSVVRHRVNFGARVLRSSLVLPFRVVFGPVRGPRAARKITYEVSWRISRTQTYRASGLPGRLFYAES